MTRYAHRKLLLAPLLAALVAFAGDTSGKNGADVIRIRNNHDVAYDGPVQFQTTLADGAYAAAGDIGVGGREIGRVVRSCHERWDGGGYPDGLAGERIPLLARIVSCCDAYDAMTSDRSYRKALPQEAAIAELWAGSGTQFDPRVVEALTAALTR